MPLFKALPTGTIVGTTDTQTLSNKTLSGDTFQSGGYAYLGNFNTGAAVYPRAGTDLAIAYNFGNGTREIDFWNTDTTPATSSFNFKQLTGASAGTAIAALKTSGCSFLGTNTNDSAPASFVGEIITATLASGSAVALTNGAAANVTSISLTAGDWDVQGVVHHGGGSTTQVVVLTESISTTSATVDVTLGRYSRMFYNQTPFASTSDITQMTPVTRVSLSATTTVYLVTNANFLTSTLNAYGFLRARRVR